MISDPSKTVCFGHPKEWFVSLPEYIKCSMCSHVLNEPMNCTNGHFFCRGCIHTTLKEDCAFECPTCKDIMQETDMKICLFAVHAILDLTVHCSCHVEGVDEGCGWTGKFKDRADRECDFQLQHCPNEGCDISVQRRFLKIHTGGECDQRHVSCIFCNQHHLSCNLPIHKATCIERPVKCTCGVITALSKLTAHQTDDCVLNFADCPLFKVGMCTVECSGQVRLKELVQHAAADYMLTTRLVNAILLGSQKMEVVRKENEQGDEGEKATKRKRPRVEVEAPTCKAGQHASGKKIYIEALAEKTGEETLRTLFYQYGTPTEVSRPVRNKGYAFVTMRTPEEAQFAVERANGIFLDGVKIFVSHDNGSANKDNHPKVNECFKWRETKSCPKGSRCQYAHMIHNGAVSRDMRFVVEEARTSVTTTDGRIVKIESERS